MNETDIKSISKFLSYVLRHHPQSIGLHLDDEGWADIDELLENAKIQNKIFDKKILDVVVSTNEKKRFSYNETGNKIRANQGHSINIDLNLQPQLPPDILYHGTVEKFIDIIRREGLKKMNRQHVHLSVEKATAINVGSRRGVPVVLIINAKQMHQDGFTFLISDNGVWLTDNVPEKYIQF